MAIKNLKVLLLILLLLGFCNSVQSQTNTSNTIEKIDYLDTKTFESSSNSFVPILLQTHNGQLRFGVQNGYTFLPDGSQLQHKMVMAKGVDKKNSQLHEGRQAFTEILRMKFMADKYKDLDKESFTENASSMYTEEKNSLQAQNQLLKLANAVSSVPLMAKHFCNPKTTDCNYDNENYYRGVRNTHPWGGKGANEFKQLNSYTSYVSAHLKPLQKWSRSLVTDNSIDGYLVLTARPGKYDFNAKGYWLSYENGQNSWDFIRFHMLAPKTIHERKLTSSNTSSILYRIPVDKAEKFSENTKIVYLVFKVKVQLKGIDAYTASLKSSFSLENSVIELYDNEGLKTKIGEISIDENLITK